jgi:uncharacterized protein (TIGR00297 family)
MTGVIFGLGIVLNFGGALGALRKDALTMSGAVAAFIVGMAIYIGLGVAGWILLMTFFLSSTVLSRLKSEAKAEAGSRQEKGSARDAMQVVANGGIAAVAAVLWLFTRERAALVAFVAALAAANADTWAGEIGMLSSKQPRSIITMRHVRVGQSGGVTALGTVGSASGALLIGVVAGFFSLAGAWGGKLSLLTLGTAVVAGFAGSAIDSVLGTTLQARYLDPGGGITERASAGGIRAGGLPWVTNDVVNLASVLTASALAAACTPLFA